MPLPAPPTECTRAREAASLCLDGELSEIGEARLGLHLRDCAGCRAYAHEIAAVAAQLRATPLEVPRVQIFVQRRRSRFGVQSAAVAAVGLVAAVAGSSFAMGRAIGARDGAATVVVTATPNARSIRADSVQQHVLAMLGRAPVRPAAGSTTALPL
jgi:predicted anti-sigma-YlaC factor YlaD